MPHAAHEQYLLSLDQGTTSSRALVFDALGSVVASAQQEFTQHFPQPGWVEHEPEEIWQSQLACARAALEKARLPAQAICAIGIANQRETALLWDRASGQPLGRAIVWQDRRTAGACQALQAAGHAKRMKAITGLLPDPYFSASKLAWMLDNIPQARARAEAGELAFGNVDSWLIWRLTGGAQHLTDVSNASRTLLYDIHASDWSEEMLALFDIPAALLPRVLPSAADFGLSQTSLLGASLPILGVAGDQQAALFGQGCQAAGEAKNTYGTGCFALMHCGQTAIHSQHGLLSTRAAQVGSTPQYALEGSVFMAGALVQWLRDGLGLFDKAADIEALARQVPDSGGVHIIPAHAGLGAPYWRAEARGAILGLTRGSHKAHIAHAALAAIACQTTELLQAMQADSGMRVPFLRVDGGASANDLLMQMQADLLGIAVQRPAMREATAWGAALLAGLQAGVWPDAASTQRENLSCQLFQPSLDAHQAAERMAHWRQAVGRVL